MNKHRIGRAGVPGALLVVLTLAGLVAGALGAPHSAQASPPRQGTTTVAVTPASAELQCGATQDIAIRINDVTDLFGVDVRLTYDTDVLEVVDANPSAPGVQVASGDLPDVSAGAGYVQINAVDVDTGAISYAAIRLSPAPAQSGSGVIASVTFRGKAAGTSPVTLVAVALSDKTADQIPAVPVSGEIEVTCDATAVPTTVPTSPAQPSPTATTVVPQPTAGGPTAVPVPTGGAPAPACRHVVQPGETLYGIARAHGTTVYALQMANHLPNPDLIYAGQVLLLPGCQPGGDTTPPPKGCTTYVVRPGDTLIGIAMRFGDSVTSLAYRNRIVNPDLIRAGQRLNVCRSGGMPAPIPQPRPTCRALHVVRPYESLYRISLFYGASIQAITAANAIANPNLIYAGQELCIP